jgi:cell division protein ZapA
MPQVEITIGGGRISEVACQTAKNSFLMTAALLDVEASSLSTQVGFESRCR